jgi:hypothetical protein
MLPHVLPWAAQVVGVQPQTFGVPPPPHVCGAVQQVAVLWLPHRPTAFFGQQMDFVLPLAGPHA